MTQLHELLPNLYAFNVPMDASYPKVHNYEDCSYLIFLSSIQNPLNIGGDILQISPGNWSIICCSLAATEADAAKVVEWCEVTEGWPCGWKDYANKVSLDLHIVYKFAKSTESLASLIRSRGLDPEKNWLLLKLD